MAKNINKKNKNYYPCKVCGFIYNTKKFAEKCEAWCKKHKSCNLEITKHSVKQ